MKVDSPAFDSVSPVGTVRCLECPFADEDGFVRAGTAMAELCDGWGGGRDNCCPDVGTYEEACKAAEAVRI